MSDRCPTAIRHPIAIVSQSLSGRCPIVFRSVSCPILLLSIVQEMSGPILFPITHRSLSFISCCCLVFVRSPKLDQNFAKLFSDSFWVIFRLLSDRCLSCATVVPLLCVLSCCYLATAWSLLEHCLAAVRSLSSPYPVVVRSLSVMSSRFPVVVRSLSGRCPVVV